ncbi:MAG: flagellar biosynthesis anti-sigma factor FlgM [Candidatus Solibacter sp.]
MKIYDQNPIGTTASQTGRAQEAQNTGRTDSSRASNSSSDSSGDHVEFSGNLSSLSRTLGSFAASRANRVQALAEQYQAGRYTPNTTATSRGLVSELLSAGSE